MAVRNGGVRCQVLNQLKNAVQSCLANHTGLLQQLESAQRVTTPEPATAGNS